jgi:hypothetical protein
MTETDFKATLSAGGPPSGISPALQALWYAAKGDWNKAHAITQPGGPELDWVHAYLHRVEGDLSNAGYWYHRAGKPLASVPLTEEWAALVRTFLAAG